MMSGLYLEPLFHHGLPGLESMESLLQQVEDELETNTKELEECVNEILNISNALPGSKKCHSAKVAVEHMTERNLLEKNSCYDPESSEVSRLLRQVLNALDKNPGCEEPLLDSLLQLSSREGLCLPIRSATTEQPIESMVSLNAVIDSNEQANESLWEDICIRFRRYFIDCLSKLPINGDSGLMRLSSDKRWRYVQSLCTLYPSSEVWARYRSLRMHQLDAFINKLMTENSADGQFSARQAADNVEEVIKTVQRMLDEDFTVLSSGVFRKSVATFQAIQEVYLDRISDELTSTVENIQDASSGSEKTLTSANITLPNSVSVHGPFAKLRTNLLTSKSTSLDSLVNTGDAISQNALSISTLDAVVQLVSCVMRLDHHVYDLHRTMIWHTVASKKNQTKGLLKTSVSKDLLCPPTVASPRSRRLSAESIQSHFGSPADMIKFIEAPEVVEKLPHEHKPKWKWRPCFRPVIQSVACSVEQLVRDTVQRCLDEEQSHFEQHGRVEEVTVCPDLVGGRLDYPRRITKCASEIMNLLDKLLPFAMAGSESCFAVVRSAFIDTSVLNLRNCHLRLLKMCSQVPSQASTRVLYLSLATAAFIRNHLFHYEQVLALDDGKKLFSLLYRQFCELSETLSQQIIDFHKLTLSASVLRDAESHNWTEMKEFHEGERCSFPVQMWNYHMRALHFDLWSTCAPKMAQNVFLTVLQHSLLLQVQHYAQVKPSFRRTTQFSIDITTILLCTSELLVPASNSVSKMIDSCPDQKLHYDIHNSCCSLLAALAIVGSPLDTLYRVYKKGFYKKRMKRPEPDEETLTKGHHSQWLSWIRPAVFKPNHRLYDDMQTTTALYLQLKLLAAQPEPNWPLLMQALLMKDYTLPIMILSQHPELIRPPEVTAPPSCGKFGCLGDGCLTSSCCQLTSLFQPFFHVLLRCTHCPDALSKVLVPAIDRSGGWGVFDLNGRVGQSQQIPCWLNAMYDSLTPFINRVVEPAVHMILRSQTTSCEVDPLVDWMTELPCGCDLESKNEPRSTRSPDSKQILSAAIERVIGGVADEIHCVVAPLCMFYRVAQQVLKEKNIRTGHNCVGLQILADCLRLRLTNESYVCDLIGSQPCQSVFEDIKQLGECTYHILTANSQGRKKKKGGRTPGSTPRLANSYMKSHREWLALKIELITEYFHNEVFDYPETAFLEGASAEFTEHFMMSLASSIMDSDKGRRSLMQIHNLLVNNIPWLVSQLDIPPTFHSNDRGGHVQAPFNVNVGLPADRQFNPLEEFSLIGTSKFDHSSIQMFSWDWTTLLQSDLGLSETTFKTLLYHRHEFQDGSYLQENEKRPVEVLRAKFDSTPVGLV